MAKSIILLAFFCSLLNVFAFAGGNSEGEKNKTTENLPQIVIRNNTGYDIIHYKLRHSMSDEWQIQKDVILRNDNALIVNLPYQLSTQSKNPNLQQPPIDYYDIQLIDVDGDEYTKIFVLISTNAQVIEFTFDDIWLEDNNTMPSALPGYN